MSEAPGTVSRFRETFFGRWPRRRLEDIARAKIAMRMVPSKRRSSFGTNCVQCTNELIAPERSECRNEGQIRHFWHCSKCDCSFEIILPARTKSMEDVMRRIEDVMRRRDVLRSRLVA
jgi:hypothetical protein